jgi:hypothetical protein
MRTIVLKYGTISGLIASALMFISLIIENKSGFGSSSVVMGFIGMVLAFIPLYFGIREYRQTVGEGYVTFLKALNIGILIVVISGVFYTLSWMVIYYWVTPDFADKYCAAMVDQMKTASRPQKEIDQVVAEMTKYKEMCKNPFVLAAYTFPESLPMGIIISLICAGVLRKKPPTLELNNLR